MVRKLGLTVFGLGAILPGIAGAFGLGEITLKSALNQPLDATIRLSKVGDLGISEIIPKLASRKDFEQAGVGRVFFLTDIEFEVKVDGTGGATILLRSNKPVKEPFLNFIIEVEWPQGRLLREYTVLLDPPIFSEKAPAQVAPPRTEFQRVPTAPTSVQPPVTTTATTSTQSASASTSTSAPEPARTNRTQAVQSQGLGQTYGRTSRDDNLWNIAAKVRPTRSVNIQQTMLAIQDLNRDSFIDNNINLLKRGQILRIPTLEQIRSRDSRTAISDVAEQNNQWRQLLSSNRSKPPVDAPQLDGSGKVRANDTDSLGDRGRLKILAANAADATSSDGALGSDGGSGSSKISALRQELALSEEKVDSLSLANKELSDRIESIEDQLSTSGHILELKDNQIAAMQAKLIVLEKQIKDALGADAIKPSMDEGMQDVMSDGTEPDLAVNDKMMDAEQGAAEKPMMDPSSMAKDSMSEESMADKAMSEDMKDNASVNRVDIEAPEKVSAVDQIKAKLLENPLYLAAAVGVLAVVMLAFIGARRRKSKVVSPVDLMDAELEDFDDFNDLDEGSSDFDSDSDDDKDVSAELADLEDADATIIREPKQSEPTPAEEVKGELGDAIGEADIYIAYGRYAHAVDLLKQAVASEPDRMDIKMKLLEIYSETDDAEAFAEFEAQVAPLADELLVLKIAEYKASLSNAAESNDDSELADEALGGEIDNADVNAEDDLSSEDMIPELGADLDLKADLGLDLEAELEAELEADLATGPSSEEDDSFGLAESGLDIDLDLDGDSEIDTLEAELESSTTEEGDLDSDLGASSDDLASALDGLDFEDGESELSDDFTLQGADISVEDVASESDDLADLAAEIDGGLSETSPDEEFSLSLEEEIEASVEAELVNEMDPENDMGPADTQEVELALVNFEAEGANTEGDSAQEAASNLSSGESATDDFDFQLDMDESLDGDMSDLENVIAASNDELQFESTEQLEDEIAELEESLQETDGLELEPSNEDVDSSLGLDDNIVSIGSSQVELGEPESIESEAIETGDTVVMLTDAQEADQSIEVELEESVDGDSTDNDLSEEDDRFGFLADTDESATKLDLARAYIDMGDKDGAKDILQEVLSEGSDVQKQDANELLGRIA